MGLSSHYPHRGTTVCRLLPFPEPAHCAEPVGFPGPQESGNTLSHDIYRPQYCPAIIASPTPIEITCPGILY